MAEQRRERERVEMTMKKVCFGSIRLSLLLINAKHGSIRRKVGPRRSTPFSHFLFFRHFPPLSPSTLPYPYPEKTSSISSQIITFSQLINHPF